MRPIHYDADRTLTYDNYGAVATLPEPTFKAQRYASSASSLTYGRTDHTYRDGF